MNNLIEAQKVFDALDALIKKETKERNLKTLNLLSLTKRDIIKTVFPQGALVVTNNTNEWRIFSRLYALDLDLFKSVVYDKDIRGTLFTTPVIFVKTSSYLSKETMELHDGIMVRFENVIDMEL